MRRFALSLLLPLPFAALPLLALAFPAASPGTNGDPLVTTIVDSAPATRQDEPLAKRSTAADDALIDCEEDLADRS